ncbi:histidine phosphotransferase ChpT [Beijerinckia indica]|uniref:Histidine phosphotransferase ChpT C-terminal domain-containing protein n=1 Tax=Beijerinckia indica subsp. indica (strain ATCC 9039 / DSM 1715 / NCIMB 8712) TaxID=395963 RepID=B2II79_BEII9|nr:histidine phosphotransferase family protein [Beijerinckia indica]ACB94662.1 conserved hypothetical protein [Beijerinckia indica subsp. indica ATCC 9039]
MTQFSLDPMDLAALLCSRVCHDVISPVGAIVNGLEILEEEKEESQRELALDLIKKSAETASARLQFCRLAFGAAGSAGALIDTGDAERVMRGLFAEGRSTLEWHAPRVLMAKDKVKLILNLCLIAMAALPRGGVVSVTIEGGETPSHIKIDAQGTNARLAQHVPSLLAGAPDTGSVDAHGIQAFYTGLVAKSAGMTLDIIAEPNLVQIAATPIAANVLDNVA